jgi:hypothetical protein
MSFLRRNLVWLLLALLLCFPRWLIINFSVIPKLVTIGRQPRFPHFLRNFGNDRTHVDDFGEIVDESGIGNNGEPKTTPSFRILS